MAKLTFVLEDGQEVVVPLKEHTTVGREEGNDIVVDDERISPRHAELVRNADGSLQVFDLNSTAGTFVNGERQMACTLLHGDKIAFGPLNGTLDLEDGTAPEEEPPSKLKTTAPVPVPVDQEAGHLENEKKRLKAEVAALETELRDWQQRAEKERAMHHARVESMRADEERLAPVQTAVQEAEAAHREWLEAIATLSSQHEDKTTALERLNTQHFEKSTEVQRLTTEGEAARKETETLSARLKQVRDECEQDEEVLNSLRQQIIQMEADVKDEEARHTRLSESSAALETKKHQTEAAIKDLESMLTKLERDAAAAEGAALAALSANEKKLAAETQRLEKAQAQRAEIERQCQELAGTQQQIVDTRQRLAAIEQRLRDTQAATSQIGRYSAAQRPRAEETPVASVDDKAQAELARKTEAARRELAELEAKIARLRDVEMSMSQSSPSTAPAARVAVAEAAAGIPPPQIVHVDSIRITPVPMKSERFRKLGGGDPAPAAAPLPAPKAKTKKK